LIELGTDGFLFLRSKGTVFTSNRTIEISRYDTALAEIWKKQVEIEQRLEYNFYHQYDNKVFLFFKLDFKNAFELLEIGLEDGSVETKQFELLRNVEFTDFTGFQHTVFFCGLLRGDPILVKFDLQNLNSSTLPALVRGKNKDILDLYIHQNKLFLILKLKLNNRKNVVVRSFDLEGNLLRDLYNRPEREISFMDARISQAEEEISLISGVYARKNDDTADGVFLNVFLDENLVVERYHHLADLASIFDYLKPELAEKKKRKSRRKEKKGKKMKFNYKILPHRIWLKRDTLIFTGEAYFPVYNNRTINEFVAGRFVNTARVDLDGYRFSHALILKLNARGEILSDMSLAMDLPLKFELDRNIVPLVIDTKLRLFYASNNILHSKNAFGMEKETEIELILKHDGDEVKRTDSEFCRLWYNNTLIIWGFQKIQNDSNVDVDNRRDVCFVTKVSLN
jgi:hypothetical protein